MGHDTRAAAVEGDLHHLEWRPALRTPVEGGLRAGGVQHPVHVCGQRFRTPTIGECGNCPNDLAARARGAERSWLEVQRDRV